ncbi:MULTISPECIES: hypothetical protein [Enterobacteriaceae]|jgi:hypothetical protein|uniref:Uncharacterized protein n=1 Tax=Enterobacter intestinihominis TaxID=3133180 RepID=A0ABV1ZHV6_9ENTR|nr:hypothetical protein [Enterobacter hormaechei]DAK64437.1 MAG TPA: hypothetical protein [Caudoviricetes sp.]ELB6553697.1 hypothetical protein [Enterobacter hormaechei]ELC3004306.1 hypothetical protein [Enterobacter hormaechei]QLU88746.1 hypothetical protein HV254_19585 [Enterobacter hormaechei]TYF70735.1 hypothetical protein DJ539_21100 [Enterobacter hormaechei]
MSYFFLIMVITSQSMNMQVEPMESMEQCQAAIKAISLADEQRSWNETSPRINNIKCVEVK